MKAILATLTIAVALFNLSCSRAKYLQRSAQQKNPLRNLFTSLTLSSSCRNCIDNGYVFCPSYSFTSGSCCDSNDIDLGLCPNNLDNPCSDTYQLLD